VVHLGKRNWLSLIVPEGRRVTSLHDIERRNQEILASMQRTEVRIEELMAELTRLRSIEASARKVANEFRWFIEDKRFENAMDELRRSLSEGERK